MINKKLSKKIKMFTSEYQNRILKHCSPVARNILNKREEEVSSALDRFIPCR